MAQRCSISGKTGQYGNRVSHAKNRKRHVFKPNLQERHLYIPEEKRFVSVKISTRVIRTIDKIGVANTLKKYNLTVKDLLK